MPPSAPNDSASSQAPKPRLSTITVTWNHADEIGDFLGALDKIRSEIAFPIEVVVVDNGSADNTVGVIARDFPWVRLICNNANKGFAEGCNQGLAEARGDYLMLLNPDAIPTTKSLEGMLRFLESNPDVGAAGCILLHGDVLPQQSAFRLPSTWGYIEFHSMLYPVIELLKKVRYHLHLFRRTQPFDCGWLQGSCIMVPRAAYDKAGPLEPAYFIYCEDADWCLRIRKAGYRIVHLPNFHFYHRQKSSTRRAPEYCFRRTYRSMLLLANRQLPPPARDRFIQTILLDMRLRRPVYWLLSVLRPSRREAMRARVASCGKLIEILKARDPDLFDDPPPRR